MFAKSGANAPVYKDFNEGETMSNISENEKLLEQILPEVEERVQYRIVRNIIDTLQEQFYPPEEMIREEFIKSVEEAEKESGRVFKNREELTAYLDSLAGEHDV